jgi:hypothetical protein
MTKKNLLIAMFVFLILASFAYLKFKDEDTWLCVNGEWVKQGNPSLPEPIKGCGADKEIINNNSPVIGENISEEKIKVTTPKSGEEVSSPLVIEGEARGSWFFEASFPVSIEDDNGQVLASGAAQAQSDWMTEDFVSFKAELNFTQPASTTGTLILKNDNPSGLPENEEEVSIPLKFKMAELMPLKVFFSNDKLDPQITCVKVFPVERQVLKTESVGRAALAELLKGPSTSEESQGYKTSINSGVKIKSITIENGVAKVDFDSTIEKAIGGSCRVSAIRSQIIETLKQFLTIKDVVISVDGRIDDALQP